MKQKGFTLIELLATLAVVGIIAAFAAPSFMQLKARIIYDQTRNQWQTFFNAGRASAVAYQSTVIACPFNFATNKCSEQLSGDWLLFTDNNNNKTLDAFETSIRVMNVKPETTFWFYPINRKFIRFYNKPTGIYGGLMGSVSICPNGTPDLTSVHIKVNIMGRVASSKSRDANGIIMREVGVKSVKTYPLKC